MIKRNLFVYESLISRGKKLFTRVHKNKKDKINNRSAVKQQLKNIDKDN
jgi:hypothetical protein